MNGETCVLNDGRRIRYSLKKRKRDKFYLVTFRGPDNKRKERSTKEVNKLRAQDAAVVLVRNEFATITTTSNPSWDVAVKEMKRHMKGKNLRPPSIADYESNVSNLRRMFPALHGPADIDSICAEQFKVKRLEDGLSPYTVAGNLNSLRVVYERWWIRVCKLVCDNPFADIDPPKIDKKTPRIIEPAEEKEFIDWLLHRWDNWRLPVLFLQVKGAVGCRITELASLPSTNLVEGRLRFEANVTKGRKQRELMVPASLFKELSQIAGETFVFESYSTELRKIHRRRGKQNMAESVKEFDPKRMRRWLQKQCSDYFESNPEAVRFKLHNFRGTAMSKARTAKVSLDDAAVTFGCHPETMRKHYLNLDETRIADHVLSKIQSQTDE